MGQFTINLHGNENYEFLKQYGIKPGQTGKVTIQGNPIEFQNAYQQASKQLNSKNKAFDQWYEANKSKLRSEAFMQGKGKMTDAQLQQNARDIYNQSQQEQANTKIYTTKRNLLNNEVAEQWNNLSPQEKQIRSWINSHKNDFNNWQSNNPKGTLQDYANYLDKEHQGWQSVKDFTQKVGLGAVTGAGLLSTAPVLLEGASADSSLSALQNADKAITSWANNPTVSFASKLVRKPVGLLYDMATYGIKHPVTVLASQTASNAAEKLTGNKTAGTVAGFIVAPSLVNIGKSYLSKGLTTEGSKLFNKTLANSFANGTSGTSQFLRDKLFHGMNTNDGLGSQLWQQISKNSVGAVTMQLPNTVSNVLTGNTISQNLQNAGMNTTAADLIDQTASMGFGQATNKKIGLTLRSMSGGKQGLLGEKGALNYYLNESGKLPFSTQTPKNKIGKISMALLRTATLTPGEHNYNQAYEGLVGPSSEVLHGSRYANGESKQDLTRHKFYGTGSNNLQDEGTFVLSNIRPKDNAKALISDVAKDYGLGNGTQINVSQWGLMPINLNNSQIAELPNEYYEHRNLYRTNSNNYVKKTLGVNNSTDYVTKARANGSTKSLRDLRLDYKDAVKNAKTKFLDIRKNLQSDNFNVQSTKDFSQDTRPYQFHTESNPIIDIKSNGRPIFNDITGSRRIPVVNKDGKQWVYVDRGEVGSGLTGMHFKKDNVQNLFTGDHKIDTWKTLGTSVLGSAVKPFMEGMTPQMFTYGRTGGPQFMNNYRSVSKGDRIYIPK